MAIDRIEKLRTMLEQVDPTGRNPGIRATLESRAAGDSPGPVLDARRTNTEALEATMALESLDVLRRGDAVDADQQFALEAIVMPYYRPVIDVVDDYIVKDQLTSTWTKLGDLPQAWIKDRVRSVGRINVPNILYAGTGFLVGDGLLMTNRHVAVLFAQGLGTRNVKFQAGQSATIDFYHEKGQTTSESLKVEDVMMIHPWWDMAILKVKGLSPNRTPLTLSTADPTTLKDREVIVVGYPGYDPNGDQEFQRVQSRIFRDTYYVKRFQPGLFRVREDTESYNRTVSAVTHDCSTLGGNSGSAVIDIETGHVVGLHFAGAYLLANYAVSPFDLALDSRVVDTGIKFGGPSLEPRGDFYGPIWIQADSAELSTGVQTGMAGTNVQSPKPLVQSPLMTNSLPILTSDGAASWTVPLQISVTIGQPVLTGQPVSATTPAGSAPFVVPSPSERMFGRSVLAESSGVFSLDSLTANRFEWQTALSLALASKLSYEGAAAIRNTAINSWGFQTCEFIEADDTQCFIASTTEAVVVAFRGTESLGDWLGNLNAISTTRSYGIVHRGFLGAFHVVDSQLRSALDSLDGRKLLLTGHSLGGALATIAAAEWQSLLPISWIYTYGQPGVGKGNFSKFIRQHYRGKFIRFVNDDDIVPRVPPTYDHVGRLFHFDAAGNLPNQRESLTTESAARSLAITTEADKGRPMLTEVEFDQMRAQLLEQRASAKANGSESLESPVLEGFFPSFSDHSLDRYIAKIAAFG